MARQDSRHGSPEESRDAKRAYCLKASTAKVEWPYNKNAWWATSKESLLWRTTRGKEFSRWPEETLKASLKEASLKDFDIPIGSWEQSAQERSKWRGLINKGAALYENNKICEAERKRRERKAITNGPTADPMTLTCSTCNWQFRASIGLVSHQRTHQCLGMPYPESKACLRKWSRI